MIYLDTLLNFFLILLHLRIRSRAGDVGEERTFISSEHCRSSRSMVLISVLHISGID